MALLSKNMSSINYSGANIVTRPTKWFTCKKSVRSSEVKTKQLTQNWKWNSDADTSYILITNSSTQLVTYMPFTSTLVCSVSNTCTSLWPELSYNTMYMHTNISTHAATDTHSLMHTNTWRSTKRTMRTRAALFRPTKNFQINCCMLCVWPKDSE